MDGVATGSIQKQRVFRGGKIEEQRRVESSSPTIYKEERFRLPPRRVAHGMQLLLRRRHGLSLRLDRRNNLLLPDVAAEKSTSQEGFAAVGLGEGRSQPHRRSAVVNTPSYWANTEHTSSISMPGACILTQCREIEGRRIISVAEGACDLQGRVEKALGDAGFMELVTQFVSPGSTFGRGRVRARGPRLIVCV